MARRPTKSSEDEEEDRPARSETPGALGSLIRGAPLKPIRFVERELTRPDGTTLRVKVPVYPPFRLEERPAAPPSPDARKRAPARRKAG